MWNKPKVQSDTFGGDLANALLLSPPYRKPKFEPSKSEIAAHDLRCKLADLILSEIANTYAPDDMDNYIAWTVAGRMIKEGYQK